MKEKFATAFINLLKVKTLVTLALISTTCYMALSDKVDMTVFISLVTAVITYYFTKKDNENQ